MEKNILSLITWVYFLVVPLLFFLLGFILGFNILYMVVVTIVLMIFLLIMAWRVSPQINNQSKNEKENLKEKTTHQLAHERYVLFINAAAIILGGIFVGLIQLVAEGNSASTYANLQNLFFIGSLFIIVLLTATLCRWWIRMQDELKKIGR